MAPASALGMGSQAIQMEECTCNKSGNKHRSDCPRNPNNMKVGRKNQQKQNRKKNTLLNVQTYQPELVPKAQAFVASGGVVRGHRRGNNNSGRQGNTKKDLNNLRNF
jgi:hypothetical protein